jgi:hypothetical protein
MSPELEHQPGQGVALRAIIAIFACAILVCVTCGGKLFAEHNASAPLLHVHVGKTAGGTIGNFLRDNGISFREVHMRRADETELGNPIYEHVLVAIRDPVERVVSAFKWRHTVGGGQVTRLQRSMAFESELYACFPTATSFALSFHNGTGHCRELAEEAVQPTRMASANHIGRGYAYHFPPEGLEALERRIRDGQAHLYIIHCDGPTAILRDLLAMCARIGAPTTRPGLPSSHDVYPRHAERIESEEGVAALRARLAFEEPTLAKLEELAALSYYL